MTLHMFEHKETVMVDSFHINNFDMVYVWWKTKRSNVQYCKSFELGAPLSVLLWLLWQSSPTNHCRDHCVVSLHVVANMQGHHDSWFCTQNGMLYR